MRRLFGWTAGLVGIAALARILARRQARTAAGPAPELDPAKELRRKLDESRGQAASGDAGATTAGLTATAEQTETLDERRARVHAKAQEALEAMEALQEPPT